MWSADIPAQAEGTVVQYDVEGTSESGKTQDRADAGSGRILAVPGG